MSPGPRPTQRFDTRLARMLAGRPPGAVYGQREIARYCGVHHSRLQQIERGAFKKIRAKLPAGGLTGML